MCVRNCYYPLVLDNETGKKKILFKCEFPINDREDLERLHTIGDEVIKATKNQSKYQWFNKEFYKKNYEYIKMVSVPCGRCEECLKQQSRDWAFRIMAETKLWNENMFVTLTYDDEHLPFNHMLVQSEISKFNKKLRTYLDRKGLASDFRFFGVGEYGGQTARPHYHVIYFNLHLPDLKYEYTTDNGDDVFSSKFLNDVWGKGFTLIGGVTYNSAAYVARYCDKKRRLSPIEKKKLRERGIVPEFNCMSRMPGIGNNLTQDIIESVVSQCYTYNMKGNESTIPMFYVRKMKNGLLDEKQLDYYEKARYNASVLKVSQDILDSERSGLLLSQRKRAKEETLKRDVRKRGL